MKVNVIRTSDPDAVMRMSIGGMRDERSSNYFRENYERFVSRMGNHADTFVNAVKNAYEYVTNTDVLRRAKQALTRVDGAMNDKFLYHVDMETIHRPGLLMRRYVMAEPVLYKKFENNLCSGYEDEWDNVEQDMKPKLRDDYLHVMDGYVGDESTLFYADENPLTTRERFIVHNAWDMVADLIASGVDPSDFEKGEI